MANSAKLQKQKRHDPPGIRRTVKAALPDLMTKPNVLYVTVGEKRKKGQRKKGPAIVVYVQKKKKDVARPDRIPKTVAGSSDGERLKTDVVEIGGMPTAFGARSGHVLRSFDGDIGVCGLSFVKNGVGYILTNAHVACNMLSGTYGQADLLDRQQNLFVRAGPVAYWTPMLQTRPVIDDVAVIRADGWIVDAFRTLDSEVPISAFGDIGSSVNADYWYNVNGTIFRCTHAEWALGGANIRVDGAVYYYRQFWQLQMVQGTAMHGHSGAVLCRQDGNRILACGLIFGGVEPNYIFALPIGPLYRRAFDAIV